MAEVQMGPRTESNTRGSAADAAVGSPRVE